MDAERLCILQPSQIDKPFRNPKRRPAAALQGAAHYPKRFARGEPTVGGDAAGRVRRTRPTGESKAASSRRTPKHCVLSKALRAWRGRWPKSDVRVTGTSLEPLASSLDYDHDYDHDYEHEYEHGLRIPNHQPSTINHQL